MLVASLVLVAAAMTAVAVTAVPLVRGRYQLPPARRALVALIPLWQLAMMGMSLIAGAVRGAGVAWVPLCEAIVAGVGFACAAFNPRLFAGIEQAGAQDVAAARAQALEEQVGVQQAYLEQAERAAVEAVRSRHVYADEFERIAEALAAGDVPGALTAVERTDAMISRSGGRLCQHPVADALLKAKMAQAAGEDVDLQVHADVPYELELSDAELCAVVSNLVNNAIAAAARVTAAVGGELDAAGGKTGAAAVGGEAGAAGGEPGANASAGAAEAHAPVVPARPRVAATIGVAQGYLVVRVENPYLLEDEAALRELAAPRRTLRPTERAHGLPRHGWGLSIVRELAERREGSLTLEVEGGLFRATAVLKLGRITENSTLK